VKQFSWRKVPNRDPDKLLEGRMMTGMQKLLAGTVAVVVTSAAPAYATTVSVGESYTVTETGFTGNKPSITKDLTGNLMLGLNTWSTATNFLTLSPAGYSGLSGSDPTVTGTITVTLNFTEAGGVTGSLTETGIYEAKYGGAPLSGCTSSPAGDTDCIVWKGASNTPNGSVILAATLTNGQIVDVDFYNAQDWNITPKISFDLDPTPLPATLPLFAGGLGLIGYLTRRRKQSGKQALAAA
jgi:hypothetical protein